MLRIFILCCTVLGMATTAVGAEKSNIIVLLCDDLGYGDLGCFNNPENKSPHLDKLASEGVKLTSFYSPSPVCSPSRAGLMTGRTPNRAGIYDWIPGGSGVYLRPGEITVAQLLKKAGYATCHVGKWHLNSKTDGSETTPGDAGFDHWMYTQNNASPNHMDIANFIRDGKKAERMKGPSSHRVVDEAMRWLDDHRSGPFFLNLWFHETHEPVASGDEYLALYPNENNQDRRHYRGNVSQMDAAVGKLLAYLDEHKLRDNTFIVFTSDNGPETLNRYKTANRSYGVPGPLRGMKLHITEAGYRVPGIIRWPGRVQPGTVSDEPTSSLDILPTVCAIAGIEAPTDRTLDGANLVPFLSDGGAITRPHPLYWQYDKAISKPWQVSLRDGQWKLIADSTLEKYELYNLKDDIGEAKNLADAEPERVAKMLAAMKAIHAEVLSDGEKSGNPIRGKKGKDKK